MQREADAAEHARMRLAELQEAAAPQAVSAASASGGSHPAAFVPCADCGARVPRGWMVHLIGGVPSSERGLSGWPAGYYCGTCGNNLRVILTQRSRIVDCAKMVANAKNNLKQARAAERLATYKQLARSVHLHLPESGAAEPEPPPVEAMPRSGRSRSGRSRNATEHASSCAVGCNATEHATSSSPLDSAA